MLAYHGTTRTRARSILKEGFRPKPPSRRVWFAEARGYALGRARAQARRTDDIPVVLACELDLAVLRQRLGGRAVVHRKGIVAIDGRVAVNVLRSYPFADQATVPREVADWVNSLLHHKAQESVRVDHPGIVRLSRWINSRLASDPEVKLQCSELLEMAERWLPEHFFRVDIDAEELRAHRRVGLTNYEVDSRVTEPDPREAEALDCLDDASAERRVQGLGLLVELRDPDLFDWCAMFLDDDAPTVKIAALEAMAQCEDGTTEVVEPFASAEDRLARAAAIAALAKLTGQNASPWIERGLKDPEPCVRVAAARFLSQLNPREDRSILEIALHDPNPDIVSRARKITSAKRHDKKPRTR